MKHSKRSFFGELKRRIVLAAVCLAIPAMVQASHGFATVSDIDYTGMGTRTGSYTHSTVDHVWNIFNAKAGDVITIQMSTSFEHHYWIYRANNGCIQVGNTPSCMANLSNGGNGAYNGTYSFTVPTTGQYAFQLDSYIGQSGNYNMTISGSTAPTTLCTPSGASAFSSCPGNVVANITSACGTNVSYTAAAPGANLSFTKTGATSGSGPGSGSGSYFNKGVTNVTVTASSPCIGTSTCSFTVTVNDNILPHFNFVPAAVTVNAVPGTCSATANIGLAYAGDNCPGFVITNNKPAIFPLGATAVTWTVTDASGNATTATQMVNVVDAEAPVISNVPANITVNNDAGVCGATVSWSEPTATDICSGVTLPASALNGTVFPVGTTTVSYTATDGSGNTADASFTVTVTDAEFPVIAAPADITMNGYCDPIAIALGAATASDNCGGTLTVTNDAPAIFPVGTTVVTYTTTDANGNTNTATQTVTVTPGTLAGTMTVSPVNTVTGQAAYTIFKGYGPQSVTLGASATGGTAPYAHSWSTGSSASSISVSPATATTYNVTITDAHGCVANLSQAINVVNAVCGNNNNKVLVCHNGNTVCIAASAVPAHLAHSGDYLGDCGTANKGGNNEEEVNNGVIAELAHNVEIYPNPTTGIISISLPEHGDVTVSVVDMTGKLVAQQVAKDNMNHTLQLDLSGNAKGIYLVKVVTAGQTFQSRISLQ